MKGISLKNTYNIKQKMVNKIWKVTYKLGQLYDMQGKRLSVRYEKSHTN